MAMPTMNKIYIKEDRFLEESTTTSKNNQKKPVQATKFYHSINQAGSCYDNNSK